MQHTHHFAYGRILLSPLATTDLEPLRILRNRERHCFFSTQVIDRAAQVRWYENYLRKEDDIMFRIAHKDEPSEFIGAIAVYDIDLVGRTCEFGRVIVDKEKNATPGIGLDAITGICIFAFEQLGMERVIARVLKSNERAQKAYTRAGFYISGDGGEDCYNMEITPSLLNRHGSVGDSTEGTHGTV